MQGVVHSVVYKRPEATDKLSKNREGFLYRALVISTRLPPIIAFFHFGAIARDNPNVTCHGMVLVSQLSVESHQFKGVPPRRATCKTFDDLVFWIFRKASIAGFEGAE
jgi:hypothetical protein